MNFTSTAALKESLLSGELNLRLSEVYGCKTEHTEFYRERFLRCIDLFEQKFGPRQEAALFSSPGRTEIGGNHTDHQHGNVLAGSVNYDIIGVASKNTDAHIRVQSEGYPIDVIDLNDHTALRVKGNEKERSISVIRGIAACLTEMGHTIAGVDVYTISNVPKGSGISSSAAFEVLIGNIFNDLFCDNAETPVAIAKVGQFAENNYFGKPSGLLDQMACSVGGILGIDFKDNKNPKVTPVNFDFQATGHALCVIDSGADHADLTYEYAAIPEEMKRVANFFGEDYLSRVKPEEFWKKFASIRSTAGDRACLRAAHFFGENERAILELEALQRDDFSGFLKLVNESGRSSYEYLQNINPTPDIGDEPMQAVGITLCLCEHHLNGRGAFRVHGGGFAGTVQAFVPLDILDDFSKNMNASLNRPDACKILSIRPVGGVRIV